MAHEFYTILGVNRATTPQELKDRFRFLCHAYHPDKFANEPQRRQAELEFKRIKEAYDVLSDPSLRAQYDQASPDGSSSNFTSNAHSEPIITDQTLSRLWAWIRDRASIALRVVGFTVVGAIVGGKLAGIIGMVLPASPARPSDAGFVDWLTGAVVVTKKGMFFDDKWRIEKGEVNSFKVLNVEKDSTNNIYTATVSFRAKGSTSAIVVDKALIRYRDIPNSDKLQFVEFVPGNVGLIDH